MLSSWVKTLHVWLQKTLYAKHWYLPVILVGLYSLLFTYLMPIGILKSDRAYRIPYFLSPTDIVILGVGLVVILVLLVLYVYEFPKLTIKQSLVSIFICTIPFLFTHPIDALDYIGNLWYSERALMYNENPYTQTYSPERSYPLSTLPSTPESPHLPYGPVWLFTHTALYAPLRNLPLITITLIMKVVHLILVLGTMGILLKVAQITKNKSTTALTVFGMSPLVLFSFVGTLHNDIYLILGIGFSLLFLTKKRYAFAIFSMLLSVFVKYVIVLLLPLLIIWVWKQTNFKQFLKATLPNLAIFGAFTLFSVFALGIHEGIQEQSGYVGFSPSHILLTSFEDEKIAGTTVTIFMGIFVTGYLLTAISFMRQKSEIAVSSLGNYGLFIVTLCILYVLNLWNYWYITWLVPFLLFRSNKTILTALSIGFLQILSFLSVWHALHLNFSLGISVMEYDRFVIASQLIVVLTTFIVLHTIIIIPTLKKLL